MSLAGIQTRVDQISKVPTGTVSTTPGGDRDACIAGALLRYNQDRPRNLVAVVAAVGSSTWEYSLSANITGWNPSQYSFSRMIYPHGQQSLNEVDANDYDFYRKAAGTYWVRFLRNAPAAGYNMGWEYTAPHELDSDSDTVSSDYPNDVEAFCRLAASFVLDEAANKFAQLKGSEIGADSVDYTALVNHARTRANDLREQYEEHVKADAGGCSGRVDWDTFTDDGADFLLRPSWNQ